MSNEPVFDKLSISRRAAFAGLGLMICTPFLRFATMPQVAYADESLGQTFDVPTMPTGTWIHNFDHGIGNPGWLIPMLMRFIVDARSIDPNTGVATLTMRFDKQVTKPWSADGVDRVYYNKHHRILADGTPIGEFGPGWGEEVSDFGSIRHESGQMTVTVRPGQTVHITSDGYTYGTPGILDVGSTYFDFYLKMIQQWTVTFTSGFGSNDTLKTEKVLHGGSATAPTPPKRTGYTFTGWDKAFDNVTSDLTVTAQWRPNTYTIKFHGNGSEVAGATADQKMTYDVADALHACGFTRNTHEGTGALGETLICH